MLPRNRYVTINCATGEHSQHETRIEAALAFIDLTKHADWNAPRPRIAEWCADGWRVL